MEQIKRSMMNAASPELQDLGKVRADLRQFLDTSHVLQPPSGDRKMLADMTRLSLSPIAPSTDADQLARLVLSESDTSQDTGLLEVDDSIGILQQRTQQLLSQLHRPKLTGKPAAAGDQPLQSTLDVLPSTSMLSESIATPSALLSTDASQWATVPRSSKSPQSPTAESSLAAENLLLRQSIERERLRRKTCEKKIHGLHEKLLLTQQQLAMALAQRRKRELMLQQVDQNLLQLASGWQAKEEESSRDIRHVREELERQRMDHMQQTEMLEQCRLQLSHAQQTGQEERQRAESLRQENAAEVQRLSAEHTSTLQQLSAEREHVVEIEGRLTETQLTSRQLEAQCRASDEALSKFQRSSADEHQKALHRERELSQEDQASSAEQIKTLKEHLERSEKQQTALELELEATLQEKDSLVVSHAVELARTQAAGDKALTQARTEMDRELATKASAWRDELFSAETQLREHTRQLLEQLQGQHHAELQSVTGHYKSELMDMDHQLNAIEDKYKEKLAEADRQLREAVAARQNLAEEKTSLGSQIETVLQTQRDEVLRLLKTPGRVPSSRITPSPTSTQPPSRSHADEFKPVSQDFNDSRLPTSQSAGAATSTALLGTRPKPVLPTNTVHMQPGIPTPVSKSPGGLVPGLSLSTGEQKVSHMTRTSPKASSSQSMPLHQSPKAGQTLSRNLASSPIVALSERYNSPPRSTNVTHSSPAARTGSSTGVSGGSAEESQSLAARDQLALLLSRIAGQRPTQPVSPSSGRRPGETTSPPRHSVRPPRSPALEAPLQPKSSVKTRAEHISALTQQPPGQSSDAVAATQITHGNAIRSFAHTSQAREPHPAVRGGQPPAPGSPSSVGSATDTESGAPESDTLEMAALTSSFVQRLQAHQDQQTDLLSYLNRVLESSPSRRPMSTDVCPVKDEVQSSAEDSAPLALPVATSHSLTSAAGRTDFKLPSETRLQSALIGSAPGHELLSVLQDIMQASGGSDGVLQGRVQQGDSLPGIQAHRQQHHQQQQQQQQQQRNSSTYLHDPAQLNRLTAFNPVPAPSFPGGAGSQVAPGAQDASAETDSSIGGDSGILYASAGVSADSTIQVDSSLPYLPSPVRYTLAFPQRRPSPSITTTAEHSLPLDYTAHSSMQDHRGSTVGQDKLVEQGADTPYDVAANWEHRSGDNLPSRPSTSTVHNPTDPSHYPVLSSSQSLSPSQRTRLWASHDAIAELESAAMFTMDTNQGTFQSKPTKAASPVGSPSKPPRHPDASSAPKANQLASIFVAKGTERRHAAGLGPVEARTGLAPFLRTSTAAALKSTGSGQQQQQQKPSVLVPPIMSRERGPADLQPGPVVAKGAAAGTARKKSAPAAPGSTATAARLASKPSGAPGGPAKRNRAALRSSSSSSGRPGLKAPPRPARRSLLNELQTPPTIPTTTTTTTS